MDNVTRSELKLILSGLHREREAMRKELFDMTPTQDRDIMDVEEYRNLVCLQEKILRMLDKMTY